MRTGKFALAFTIRCWFFTVALIISTDHAKAVTAPPFINPAAAHWADSVLQQLSPDERIGQLFMVAAWSNKDSAHIHEITKLIEDWKIGGLIFFQGGPVRQALLTNYYQEHSRIPLMIGIDGEWGLPMRLDSTVRYPRQMTLAAIGVDSLIYQMGTQVAQQCKRLGIHINFAPDADVNNNPLNPVIGSRSFGDDPILVAKRALNYMRGLQDHGVLANAKHFPGHGNADSDSHLTLPTITQSKREMDSVELHPFKKLIDAGVGSMMVAHLNVPVLDSTPNLPSTLSKPIVSGLLQGELGFQGLVFTDALNMKGVSSCYRPGKLDVAAILAGNDVLLYSEDVHKAVEEIHAAIDSGLISSTEIDRRAKKVLMAKYWCGLGAYRPVDTAGLYEQLNPAEALSLQRKLYERSITLLANKSAILPLKSVGEKRIAVVSIGAPKDNRFQQVLSDHLRTDNYSAEKDASTEVFAALFDFLRNYDLVILSLHGTNMRSQSGFGISENARQFVDTVMVAYPTVFADFGNAYTLSRFSKLSKAKAIVMGYEDFSLPQELAAELLVGAATSKARLPINATADYRSGAGTDQQQRLRLSYGFPQDVGMDPKQLDVIDSIVDAALRDGATPGCQVLVARSGKVVYDKSFGYQSYDSLQAVRNDDLYDVASVTKIAATALAAMKLSENGQLDINATVGKYLPKLRADKRALVLKEVFAHQSGLPSWIPFWKKTVRDSQYLPGVYTVVPDAEHSIRVCDSLYLRKDYSDSIRVWVSEAQLGERGKYVYSDLGPILTGWMVERITGKPLDQFLEERFYRPLQLHHSGFKAWDCFTPDHLIPTELDVDFRKRQLRGDVHDPAAAMQGGVSGNAGYFSNAYDLAVLMQLLLNEGTYGGQRLLKKETIRQFTSRQFPQNKNRRGLFFDKPETEPGKPSPCCASASSQTFGHQGFTGTCVWVDPQYDLIYVFLSNRIHPSVSNELLSKMNVRTSIQQAVYDAIIRKQ